MSHSDRTPSQTRWKIDDVFSIIENDGAGAEAALYEKFLIDDFDNYMDEINDRLTISRLVNDSVVKGMVNAVVEETAERISSKEAEIAILKGKLQALTFTVAASDRLQPLMPESLLVRLDSKRTNSSHAMSYLQKGGELSSLNLLGSLRVSIERQAQRLKEDIEHMRRTNCSCRSNISSANFGFCRAVRQSGVDFKLQRLGRSADSLIKMLDETFNQVNRMMSVMKFSLFEMKFEYELQAEITGISLQNFLRDLEEEYETKLFEQRKLANAISKDYEWKINELSSVRKDVDAISTSLFNLDQTLSYSHTSNEAFEEVNSIKWREQFPKSKYGKSHSQFASNLEENGAAAMQKSSEYENPVIEFVELPQLKHLSKEELAAFYKTEMTKMRRQHDKAMEEKTEELFRLKRQFLKEKASLISRKDKELEYVRKNIPQIILKLDDILLDKERFLVVFDDCDELCALQHKADSLFLENQRLRGVITGNRKEIEFLSSEVLDAQSQLLVHSSEEASLLLQIEKLKENLIDIEIEANTKDELDGVIWREVISRLSMAMENMIMETKIIHEIYLVLVRECICEAMAKLNITMLKQYAEMVTLESILSEKEAIILKQSADKANLESLFSEKEMSLQREIEEGNKMKHDIKSLLKLMEEKEKIASEAESTIMQQKQHFELINIELDVLRDQVSKQGLLISENKVQSDKMKNQLDETFQHLHMYEMEIDNLNQKLAVASNSLLESERKISTLKGTMKEKEEQLLSANIDVSCQQVKQVETILRSLKMLSQSFLDFEGNFTASMERVESRLTILRDQCCSQKQHEKLLLKQGLWYKKMFEIRTENLQKAEVEVDLLGDEVDALLSLLGKVYVALDHYSPVLQHYSGFEENCKAKQADKGDTKSGYSAQNRLISLCISDVTSSLSTQSR
ncbi:hypothetical protein AXF42_Ash010432 [Apostasia shenzhenica]|uniref:WPP domain-associated protein n=1 Tax=Apostasia shenzhenica TaxID=1088818 RepID=A0A2I0BDZ2_9ASPA|nr:hypothetical protein AXF42_Ash010432 [Apostasia shenzhenica]